MFASCFLSALIPNVPHLWLITLPAGWCAAVFIVMHYGFVFHSGLSVWIIVAFFAGGVSFVARLHFGFLGFVGLCTLFGIILDFVALHKRVQLIFFLSLVNVKNS